MFFRHFEIAVRATSVRGLSTFVSHFQTSGVKVQWGGYLAFHENGREGVKDDMASGTTKAKGFCGYLTV